MLNSIKIRFQVGIATLITGSAGAQKLHNLSGQLPSRWTGVTDRVPLPGSQRVQLRAWPTVVLYASSKHHSTDEKTMSIMTSAGHLCYNRSTTSHWKSPVGHSPSATYHSNLPIGVNLI